MPIDCPRIVIAGTNSGVGKTSVTLALVSALKKRGLRLQTFKVGPDYLDPTYLAKASGSPCYNLDGWMTGRDYVVGLFAEKSRRADIAVIEGVMGLFDGRDPVTAEGSTAEIAAWLNAPVILVVNVHGLARSVAAMVKGFTSFDPSVHIMGVIANHSGSPAHGKWLADSLAAFDLPPVVASLPRGSLPELPSRHLGLVSADEDILTDNLLSALGNAVETNGSVDEILRIAGQAPQIPDVSVLALIGTVTNRGSPPSTARENFPPLTGGLEGGGPLGIRDRIYEEVYLAERRPNISPDSLKLGIARDKAFHFYYPDNLEALAAAGCELVEFSPLLDHRLPEKLDGLYIGGGYPEEHALQLSENKGMLQEIREFAAAGRPLYAECGGLMYLSQGIESLAGERFPLVGLLPWWTRMLPRLKSLGYAEVTLKMDSLFGRVGARLRGHEFHYSELVHDTEDTDGWQAAYLVSHRRSAPSRQEGFQRGQVLASYVHTHFASSPEAVSHFVAACRIGGHKGERPQ